MDAIEVLKTRRSVRAYKREAVPRKTIEDIVDCGRLAATAVNIQPWEFVVVTDQGTRRRIASYTEYGKFIADAKAKGATPIMCTLVPRKIWKDGKIVRAGDSYGKWAADVAAQEGVGLVDLNEIIARKYDALGAEKVEPLFGDEHTHTSRAGAELNADCVVEGLKGLRQNPLAAYLK